MTHRLLNILLTATYIVAVVVFVLDLYVWNP